MSFESSRITKPSPAAALAPTLGAVIAGKYRLERLLGQGGMGTVWQARNLTLDSCIAVKVLHPAVRDPETTMRLLTEARVEANLQHPSIVRVFDYGDVEHGDAYIAMELLEGSCLSALLDARGAQPASAAVRLMLPIIHGLCAAHDNGVVHRDLKPENIFIAQVGGRLRPKLLDFGIAKLRGEVSSKLTFDGNVLGSPAYMAPEQARGSDDVDERVDIWASCVVIYELIAGTNPFAAKNAFAILHAVVEHDPQALVGPGCETLWPILQRGLIKDREHRVASARELGNALARWLILEGHWEDACGEPLTWNWAVSTASVTLESHPLAVVRDSQAAARVAKPSDRNLAPHSLVGLVGLVVLGLNLALYWNLVDAPRAHVVTAAPVETRDAPLASCYAESSD